MSHFEIEIKSLLGEATKAEELVIKMLTLDPACQKTSHNSQLNHYFTGGNIHELFSKVEYLFSGDQHNNLKPSPSEEKNFPSGHDREMKLYCW